MAWIRTISLENADGLLELLYDAAVKHAGRVYNIIRLQSQRPEVLRRSTQLYIEVMHCRESALSHVQ